MTSDGGHSVAELRDSGATDARSNASGEDSDDEVFIYPGGPMPEHEEHVAVSTPHPSPAQLESLYAAASSGDLPLLKRLFHNALDTGDVQPFALANDASTRTGFTALHAAASRGYLDIVTWRESTVFLSLLSSA